MPVEEIEWMNANRFFNAFFNRLEISVGFYIYFGNSRFRARAPRKLLPNVKRDSLRFTVSVSSSSRLVLSKDNLIENVDRSISLVEDSER